MATPEARQAVAGGRQRLSRAELARRGLFAGALAGTLAASIGGLVMGTTAGAQAIAGFDSRAPVSYAADRIELQDRAKRVILSGDVVIEQGDLRLTAARTTVAYEDTGTLSIQRINATGNVTVTRGNERASGAAGVYDFNQRVIVLSGGVALVRGGDTMNGGRLVINLATGQSSMDGSGAAPVRGETGDRVTGSFSVPE